MHLHFDHKTFKEYEANDLLARLRDKEPAPEYNLFMHFLDFVSIDSKEFLTFLYSQFKNTIYSAYANEDICVRDMLCKNEILEISERVNQQFNVNFSADFYNMLQIEYKNKSYATSFSDAELPPKINNFIKKELFDLIIIIDDYIELESPVPLNMFLSIYKNTTGMRPDSARIPPQTFHSLKKSLDSLNECRNPIYKNYDDYITTYDCNGIIDLVNASMFEIIQKPYQIKKCGNCNHYFVPFLRSDAKYCDRPISDVSNKTCKDVGREKTWRDKLKIREDLELYKKIYAAKSAQVKRYIDHHHGIKCKESFDAFKADTKEWKQRIKKIHDVNQKNAALNEYIKRLHEWKNNDSAWNGQPENTK